MILPGSQGGKVSAQKVRMAFLREQKVRSDEDRSRKEVLKRKKFRGVVLFLVSRSPRENFRTEGPENLKF